MNHLEHSTVWALPTDCEYTVTFASPPGVPLGLELGEAVPTGQTAPCTVVLAMDPVGQAARAGRVRPGHWILSVNGWAAVDFGATMAAMTSGVRPLVIRLVDPCAVGSGTAAAAVDPAVEVVSAAPPQRPLQPY